MKTIFRFILLSFSLTGVLISSIHAQGYLHRSEKNIVDGNGTNFIIKSIGTGNWMLQEGYMMKTSDVAGTQHEFREKLIESIGVAKTDSFYNAWLEYNMTKADIDSMKAWGFNAIRPALHYKWFTPPIEDEPISGTITWLNKGFDMVDSLLKWCAANEMYVILDMHGTPGGQGKDAAISDYDPSKLSLWESQANKDKLIALWKKLAERYSDEPWIGGYDLINEPNWTFAEPNNAPLWNIYKDITTAIREVDQNHLIFIEGNWFANDFSGLPTIWDNNLALSFHKYWNYNDQGSIQWMIDLRNQRNVPIWLGESGENSNTWFTNLIALCESKNIGWSWWPVKKVGLNNVMQVEINNNYDKLIRSWKGEAPTLTEDEAFAAVLTFAENHKIENCEIHYDVIDAMIRQPHSQESLPFKNHAIGDRIFFADYDFGRNNVAYFDNDTANYHLNTQEFVNWNRGWSYRNDGVDIEPCSDSYATNGYHVGWIEQNEWLQYTIETDSAAAYSFEFRSSSESKGAVIQIEINGEVASEKITLPLTGNWNVWETSQVDNIIIPAGTSKIRFYIEEAGSNLNYFLIKNPISDFPFTFLSAKSEGIDQKISVSLNKSITNIDDSSVLNDIVLTQNGVSINIKSCKVSTISDKVIEIFANTDLLYTDKIELSYSGTSIEAEGQNLEAFNLKLVQNKLTFHHAIPGAIEAEDYYYNNGLELEDCEDFGNGKNLGFADAGDYVDFYIYTDDYGAHKLDLRLATLANDAELILYSIRNNNKIPVDTIAVNSTGGWQEWKTQSTEVSLQKGLQFFQLYIKRGQVNINWIKFGPRLTNSINELNKIGFNLYPNPSSTSIHLDFSGEFSSTYKVDVISIEGKKLITELANNATHVVDISTLSPGMYIVKVTSNKQKNSAMLIVN